MTASELATELSDKFGMSKWPDHYEVDAETYANVCQHVFDGLVVDGNFGTFKRVKGLSLGQNNGIMFKNVEIILSPVSSSPLLTVDEIRTLYNLLKAQYISYENDKGIAVVRKLRDLVGEDV